MPFDAMQRITVCNLLEDLEVEVGRKGTYLQKVAFRIGKSDDSDGLGDVLQAAMFVAEKDPTRGQTLIDLLDQYSQQSLQAALNKIVTESEDPSKMESDRIGRMADLLRARIELGREQMKLMQVQKTVAQEMGLSNMNPATAATGQMPLPIAGGAPPMPMPAPGQVPMIGPPPGPMPGPSPMPGPMPGAAPAPTPTPTPTQVPGGKPMPKKMPGANQRQQFPTSPMEAAAL